MNEKSGQENMAVVENVVLHCKDIERTWNNACVDPITLQARYNH